MEDNNFFGFVSKIGSLITNNKPKESKKIKPMQKKYNIKISTEVEDEKEGYRYKIVGCSCYAGDTFGEYYLNKKLDIGDFIVFKDTASYTMVKNNIFNGISFPNLYVIDINKNLEEVKNYGYDVFKMII